MRTLILVAAASLALAGCAHTGIARPSDAYLVCLDEPELPAALTPTESGQPAPVTDEQDATYKSQLRTSWQDCNSKVQYIHDWFGKLPR